MNIKNTLMGKHGATLLQFFRDVITVQSIGYLLKVGTLPPGLLLLRQLFLLQFDVKPVVQTHGTRGRFILYLLRQ